MYSAVILGRWWLRPAFGIAGSVMALLLVALPVKAASPSFEVEIHRAQAFDPDSGALVYSQEHRYLARNGQPVSAEVVYHDADGKLYARKTLDFSKSTYAPFFETRDVKNQYREAFVPAANEGEGTLVSGPLDGEAECGKSFERDADMVIDAGFNSFLADNLETIASGDTVKFDLYLAKACRGITFRAKLEARQEGKLIVAIAPSNFMFRMVVGETVAEYDAKTGQLLSYVGLSDLNDADGRNLSVKIVFEPVERKAVSQAQAEELRVRVGAL